MPFLRSRRTRTALRMVVAPVLFAAAGCALLVPLDDLSGGSAPGRDGGATEGGSLVDARVPTDSGPPVDAAQGFCDQVDARVCLDFDRDAWAGGLTMTTSNGTLGIGTKAPRSPPAHMVASSPSGPTSPARLYLEMPVEKANEITWSFDLRVDEITGADGVEFSQLKLEGCAIQPHVSLTRVGVYEYCPSADGGSTTTDYEVAPGPDLGAWHRMALRVVFGAPSRITVWWDSDTTPVVDSKVLPTSKPGPGVLQFGSTFISAGSKATQLSFDNAVARVR
jgi:hypothetical protein